MNKNIKLLFIGRFISFMGDGIFLIALPLYFLSNISSLISVGLFFMLVKIPAILLTPYIGVFVEKINKKRGLIVSDFLSGFLFTLLAISLFLGEDNIIVFIIISAIYQIISSIFSISSRVLFTQLTNDENRLKLNSYKSILDNLSSLLAPTLGALLFFVIGIEGIVIVNAISFILSAILELFIKDTKITEGDKSKKITLSEYKEVYLWLKKHNRVYGLLIIVMVLNFFVASNDEIIFPAIIVREFNFAESIYGLSISVLLVGNIFASFLLTRIKKLNELSLRKLFIIESSVLITIGICANLLYNNANTLFLVIYLVMMFAAGFFVTLINVPLITEFQTKIDESMQGRFFALLSLGAHLLIPLGILFAGVSSEIIGASNTLIVNNIIVILFTLRFVRIDNELIDEH